MEDILIKCDKCGGFNVHAIENPDTPPPPKVVTMDEYIDTHKIDYFLKISSSSSTWCSGKTIRMKLHCNSCGFEKEWTKVIY